MIKPVKRLYPLYVILLLSFSSVLCDCNQVNGMSITTENRNNLPEYFAQAKDYTEPSGNVDQTINSGGNNLPVIILRKNLKEISLLFLEEKTKKIKSHVSFLPYLLTIIPTITVRDIIFPSHYFM